MASAKKELPVAPSLAEQIRLCRADAEAFVETKVMELKNSPSGSALPIDSLRMMLTKRDDCSCRVATRLLEEKSNG
jgi:hypothetical protein